MAVYSSKTSFINMKRQCTGEDVSTMITTSNQSIKDQPVLWIAHGSGGVSSSEDIILDWAKDKPITIAIVDSYSGRKVYKHQWDGKDERLIDTHTRTEDLIGTKMKFDKIKNTLFPFVGNKHYAIGFSDGATSVLRMLTDRYNEYTNYINDVFCLYPALHPYETDFLTIQGSKCHVFVGDKDVWTPAKWAKKLEDDTKCNLTILENTHHSFFKPGVKGTHSNVINASSVDLGIVDSDLLKDNFGRVANLFDIDVEQHRGVYAEYNKESSTKVLEYIERIIFQ